MQRIDIEKDKFKQEFELGHKYKDVKTVRRKNHIVVKCSGRVRNWLCMQEKMFVCVLANVGG